MSDLSRLQYWLRLSLLVLFTACMYFILARVSLYLQFQESNATPVWPPAGFAFAMVLIFGHRLAAGIFIGAFAANYLIFIDNQTVDPALAFILSGIIATGNAAESLVGNYLLRRFIFKFNLSDFLEKVDHILRFSLIAALMCIVASSMGVLTVYFAGIIDSSQFSTVWLTWWLGDFSGILLVTSLILIWLKSFREGIYMIRRSKGIHTEVMVFYLVVFLTSGIIFYNWFYPADLFQWPYWVIPILVWAAIRLSQRELVTSLAIYSIVAVIGTIHGFGPFGDLSLNDALIALQAFIAIMVITKMTLNASISELKRTEVKLRKTGDELEMRVKQRTTQLEERNQLVETILNSSFDSIIVLDPDMRCISINKIAKNQLRLPYPENVIGKKITDLPSFILPENIRSDIATALQGETLHREKFASPISEKYFEIDYIPLRNHVGVHAVMIVAHDITQRIHNELEIREQKAYAEMLIENSPYMIMACDRNLRITAWNKKSAEHTGVAKENAIDHHLLELFPAYNNQEWKSMFSQVLEEGKSFHLPQIPFLYKKGWGESFVTPLYNSYNEIIGFLSITHEITELVNMTTVLEQRNMDLVKTNEELSSFAYVASHDLQEPLRKIQIFSKRITEMESLSATGKDYFERMRKAAERMQNLIEDLLTYSRTGSVERDFEKIELTEIVNEVKEYLKDEILQKNATIISNDLCECPVIRFQFRQLLHNLIGNSLKFANPGRPPVITINSSIKPGKELPLAGLEKDRKYCHISVQDNGIGFDPTFSEQIFGLFQRLHGKSEYPGTGIGLSICKKIIENHHGVMTAEGEPGKGAKFHIYIPYEQN